MSDGIDEQELLPPAYPAYPRVVRIAGNIWIIFGGLLLLNLIGGAVLGALCGVVFIYVGIQSAQGRARDTLENGIGSIIFGLLNLGFGVLTVAGVVGDTSTAATVAGVAAIVGGL